MAIKPTKKDIDEILSAWADFLVPEGLELPDRKELAKKSGIHIDTIKRIQSRKKADFQAETLLRLMLARGIPKSKLKKLDKINIKDASQSEDKWNKLGRTLTPEQRMEMIDLITYLKDKWGLGAK